jgi:hypothetical protein
MVVPTGTTIIPCKEILMGPFKMLGVVFDTVGEAAVVAQNTVGLVSKTVAIADAELDGTAELLTIEREHRHSVAKKALEQLIAKDKDEETPALNG